jgi:hypothetical protein
MWKWREEQNEADKKFLDSTGSKAISSAQKDSENPSDRSANDGIPATAH